MLRLNKLTRTPKFASSQNKHPAGAVEEKLSDSVNSESISLTAVAKQSAEVVEEISKQDSAENSEENLSIKNRALLQKMLELSALVVGFLGSFKIPELERLVIHSYCHEIKTLITEGADPNLKIKGDFTPLHMAIFVGNIELLQFLLKRPDVNLVAADFEGQTPLHISVSQNKVLTTLMLLRAIKNNSATHQEFADKINQSNKAGFTPIQYAGSAHSDSRLFYVLIDYGAESGLPEEDLRDFKAKKGIFEVMSQATDGQYSEMIKYFGYVISHNSKDEIEHAITRFVSILDISDFARNYDPIRQEIFKELIEELVVDLENLATDSNLATKIFYRSLEISERVKLLNPNTIGSEKWLAGKNSEEWKINTNFTVRNLLDLCSRVSKKMDLGDQKFVSSEELLAWIEKDKTKKPAGSSLVKSSVLPEGGKKKIGSLKSPASSVASVAVENFVQKTPAEKLRDLMFNLHKSAARGEKERYPEENRQNSLVWLKASGEVDVKTTNNWTLLHIASRLGNVELVSQLIALGADVNAKTSEGFSVLKCAAEADSKSALGVILSSFEVDLEEVSAVLKNEIKSRNKSLVSEILSSQVLLNRIGNLDKKSRETLLQDWRSFNKKNPSSATEDFRKGINVFEAELNNLNPVEDVEIVEEPQKISKKERERIRKAQNKIKREEEEKEKQQRQQRKEAELKIRQEEEKIKREEEEKILSEIGLMLAQDFNVNQSFSAQKISHLPTSASENISASTVDFASDQQQMQNFLRSSHQINSVADLPEFLQPKIKKFLAEDCLVFLKGSAVWGRGLSGRTSTDLDLELSVQGIATWSNKQIVNFVRENFAVEISSQQIYRKISRDGNVFTVNFKDEERLLDISIYDKDPRFLPPSFLGWTNSREAKIFFDSEGKSRFVRPFGLEQSVLNFEAQGSGFNYETDFLINPQARGLLMRLCFLQTAGLFTKPELAMSLWQISPKNPVDLLFKELKLDQSESLSNQGQWIEKKISDFAKSHSLNREQKADFVQNLNYVIWQQINLNFDSRTNPEYQILYKTLAKMEQENLNIPSQNPSVISAAILAKKVREKT